MPTLALFTSSCDKRLSVWDTAATPSSTYVCTHDSFADCIKLRRTRKSTNSRQSIGITRFSGRHHTSLDRPMAEGVGFEPTIRLPVYTLSKRAPSATRPSLLGRGSAQYSEASSLDNPRREHVAVRR